MWSPASSCSQLAARRGGRGYVRATATGGGRGFAMATRERMFVSLCLEQGRRPRDLRRRDAIASLDYA